MEGRKRYDNNGRFGTMWCENRNVWRNTCLAGRRVSTMQRFAWDLRLYVVAIPQHSQQTVGTTVSRLALGSPWPQRLALRLPASIPGEAQGENGLIPRRARPAVPGTAPRPSSLRGASAREPRACAL